MTTGFLRVVIVHVVLADADSESEAPNEPPVQLQLASFPRLNEQTNVIMWGAQEKTLLPSTRRTTSFKDGRTSKRAKALKLVETPRICAASLCQRGVRFRSADVFPVCSG